MDGAMSNYKQTADWLKACGKEPGDVKTISVQMGCDMEEYVELIDSFGWDENTVPLLGAARDILSHVASMLKSGKASVDLDVVQTLDALDALCDREVTGNGLAYLLGFDKDGADKAVIASNWAKLVDGKPILKPGGKIAKPEGWTAPDLKPFI